MENNNVTLLGRVARHAYVGKTRNGEFAHYTVAVDRHISKKNDKADFIDVVLFGTADYIDKVTSFAVTGARVAVQGHIQTGAYKDKNGNKQFGFEVVADSFRDEEPKANDAKLVANERNVSANKNASSKATQNSKPVVSGVQK